MKSERPFKPSWVFRRMNIAEVNAWGCDVTDTGDVRRTIEDIGVKFGGPIDILVAAAGMPSKRRTNHRYL